MDALRIGGGSLLRGEITVSGSKNASLPIMAAALLSNGRSVLRGVPDLADVRTFGALLEYIGATVEAGRDFLMPSSQPVTLLVFLRISPRKRPEFSPL